MDVYVGDEVFKIGTADSLFLPKLEPHLRLENDLRDGTNSCPTFDDAGQLHRLLAAIEETAANGKRRSLAWR
jgi:hypothetical protein